MSSMQKVASVPSLPLPLLGTTVLLAPHLIPILPNLANFTVTVPSYSPYHRVLSDIFGFQQSDCSGCLKWKYPFHFISSLFYGTHGKMIVCTNYQEKLLSSGCEVQAALPPWLFLPGDPRGGCLSRRYYYPFQGHFSKALGVEYKTQKQSCVCIVSFLVHEKWEIYLS